jgi:hypothetical protein
MVATVAFPREDQMPNTLFGKNWNINKGASLFSVGPPPDTETRRYDEIPNGYTLKVTGVRGGQPYSWGYTALYDGQPHPVTGRDDIDAITAYKVDDQVTLGFFTKVGVDGGAYARKLTVDGSGLKVIAAGKQPDGSAYFDVVQYT